MAKSVLTNVRAFVNGTDLTGYNNKIELAGAVEEKESTTFGSGGSKEYLGGIGSGTLSAEGLWSAGDLTNPDDVLSAALGQIGPWTICPTTPAAGDLSWQLKALESKYTIGGSIGDVAPWQAGGSSSSPLVRGMIAHPPGLARTTTGSGTAVQAGAVLAGQALYANLHVLGVSGTASPSIAVKVQSATSSGFTSPTDRGTFTTVTAANQGVGQTLKIPGAVTDTWWRVSWTITGTTPSFLLVAAVGIA